MVNTMEEHLPDYIELYKVNGQSYGWDRWNQDSMQTGFSQWPGATGFESMKVHMQLQRSGGLENLLPNELLGNEVGYVYPRGTDTSLNSGGNQRSFPLIETEIKISSTVESSSVGVKRGHFMVTTTRVE